MMLKVDVESLFDESTECGVVPISVGLEYGAKLYGFMDSKTKKMVHGFDYTYVSKNFEYELTVVRDRNFKYGIMKNDGSFLLEPTEEYKRVWIDDSGVVVLDKTDDSKELRSVETFELLTDIKLEFADVFDMVVDEQGIWEVHVADCESEDKVGLLRSDGVWIAKPEYKNFTVNGQYLIAEKTNGIKNLIFIKNGTILITGKLIDTFEQDRYCSIYLHKASESGKIKMTIVNGDVVETTIDGYFAYSAYTSDWIICSKFSESTDDVFSLSKKEFVLKDISDITEFKSEDSFKGLGLHRFYREELVGIISENGDVLLDSVATDISVASDYDDEQFGPTSQYWMIEVNGLIGIWHCTKKAWIILPQWNNITYLVHERLYLVEKLKARKGSFCQKNILMLLSLDARAICDIIDVKVDKDRVNGNITVFKNGYARVKLRNKKWITIDVEGNEVILSEEDKKGLQKTQKV